jgi:CDP-diacylglycerol--serine O-phosphatidyltransferase
MARSKFVSLDSLSLQDFDENSELIPLMTTEDEKEINNESLPETLPILSLRNTVLFPGVVIPITAGRDKSIRLIDDANKGSKVIGVVSQKDESIEDPGAKDIHETGTVARILKVSGDLGKQLDSLADMVTSGVVPGIVLFVLLGNNQQMPYEIHTEFKISMGLPLIGLLVTLSACYRLAKFNLDTRQSESFIGLPTPAMSLFVVSLPLVQMYTDIDLAKDLIANNYFLIGVTVFFSFIMNSELPLFSLKFKNYGIRENLFKYILITLSIVLVVTVEYLSVPIVIVSYILLSMINNYKKTNTSS